MRDNVQLDPNAYRVLLGGQEIAGGELRAGQFLAMDPSGSAAPIEGIETTEPAFGLPARWIQESDKDRAELLGYTVIDAASVLITHLTETLKGIAGELLSRDDVKSLVDNAQGASARRHRGADPQPDDARTGAAHPRQPAPRVGADPQPADNPRRPRPTRASRPRTRRSSPSRCARACRARSSNRTSIRTGVLHAVFLDPDLERNLAEALAGAEGASNLPAGFLGKFVDNTAEALSTLARDGRDPVLVTRASLRPFLAEAVAGVIPNAAVLSYQETSPAKKVETSQRVAVAG